MEIFQNIWTVLTTENERLTNILSTSFAFADAAFVFLFFTLILNIHYTQKQKFTYIILISLLSIISNTLLSSPFNTLAIVVSCFLSIMIIFKLKFLKAIIAELLPNIILVFVGIIVHNVYMLTFNVSTNTIVCVPIHKILSCLFVYLFTYIVYRIMKHFKVNIYLLDDLKRQINSPLVINFVFGIIAVFIQSYISSFYSDVIPFYVTLLNIGVLLLYFVFSLYSLIRTNTLEKTKRDLEQSQQYNKTLTILHDNIRCFKHDFSNIVTTIGGYVQSNDLDGLKKFYTELLGDCQKVNNLSTLSPSVINEPAIYSLLANKYYLADEKGIKINLEIFLDLTDLHMKVYEFTRILRNFNG